MADIWWERRHDGELTTEYLGRVLDELGTPDMATRARRGEFDDFQCPTHLPWAGMELNRLIYELDLIARHATRQVRERARAIIAAVKAGEFDATSPESARWAASAEGQRTFAELLKGQRQ